MAESNLPKQDFAPHWLKFPPADASKSPSQKSGNQQSDRSRARREDPYYSISDYSRLHRQSSFDFHEGKKHSSGQGKFRHHSVEDEYYQYPYNYGYYPPGYNYEKYGMQYSSQPSLARNGGRDGKYGPGRYASMNGNYGSPYDLYDSYHQGPSKRSFYDKDHHRFGRDRASDRDRPYSDDFPSLNGSGEPPPETKQTKTASGVWENPPKSSRTEESTDLLKNSSPGIYKALVPSKGGHLRKNGREPARVNGTIPDSSPLSPSNKPNHKEGTRQSPTTDLAIVTHPKKLGDKKNVFLRGLREDQNQNAVEKKSAERKEEGETVMNGDASDFGDHMNGDIDSNENVLNGEIDESPTNGEMLVKHVDHINLSGEDEEKRLLLSMGWVEEDNTEYVITDEEIREVQNLLESRCKGKKNGLKASLLNALNMKLENNFTNGVFNGTPSEKENDKHKLL